MNKLYLYAGLALILVSGGAYAYWATGRMAIQKEALDTLAKQYANLTDQVAKRDAAILSNTREKAKLKAENDRLLWRIAHAKGDDCTDRLVTDDILDGLSSQPAEGVSDAATGID